MVVVVVVVTPARRHLAGAGAQITRQDGEREQKQIAKALLVSLPSGATNTQTVAARARRGRRLGLVRWPPKQPPGQRPLGQIICNCWHLNGGPNHIVALITRWPAKIIEAREQQQQHETRLNTTSKRLLPLPYFRSSCLASTELI